jgi:hypothetical protein
LKWRDVGRRKATRRGRSGGGGIVALVVVGGVGDVAGGGWRHSSEVWSTMQMTAVYSPSLLWCYVAWRITQWQETEEGGGTMRRCGESGQGLCSAAGGVDDDALKTRISPPMLLTLID